MPLTVRALTGKPIPTPLRAPLASSRLYGTLNATAQQIHRDPSLFYIPYPLDTPRP